jgi:hypothetical protein
MRFQKQSQLLNFMTSPERKQLRTAINPISIFIKADIEKERVVLLSGFENLFTNNTANVDPKNVPIHPPTFARQLQFHPLGNFYFSFIYGSSSFASNFLVLWYYFKETNSLILK